MMKLLLLVFMACSVQADTVMYVLAAEWPGSVCLSEKCQKAYMGSFDARRWNLHGLWPNGLAATSCPQISTCTSEVYDPFKLSPATTALVDLAWNGLYSDSTAFRKHEWEKHGTCHPDRISQDEFFQLAGGLAKNHNYYEILAAYGIYPDNNRVLTDADIKGAFAQVVGSGNTFTYTCAKANNKLYIAEIRICFTQSLQKRTCNCSKNLSAFVSCGAQFYYPTYSL